MRYRIYHSLDRPSSVFGIKGRFLLFMLLGMAMSGILALVFGKATQMLIGVAVMIAGCTASYLAVIWAQTRTDERDIMKAMGHGRLPMCWSVRPSAMRNIWKGIN